MFSDLKVAVILAQRRAEASDVDDDGSPPAPRAFPRPTKRDLRDVPWGGPGPDPRDENGEW